MILAVKELVEKDIVATGVVRRVKNHRERGLRLHRFFVNGEKVPNLANVLLWVDLRWFCGWHLGWSCRWHLFHDFQQLFKVQRPQTRDLRSTKSADIENEKI